MKVAIKEINAVVKQVKKTIKKINEKELASKSYLIKSKNK